jgi:uncharacterized protein YggL (DUF469 family)
MDRLAISRSSSNGDGLVTLNSVGLAGYRDRSRCRRLVEDRPAERIRGGELLDGFPGQAR